MSKVFNPSDLDKHIERLQKYDDKPSYYTVEIRNVKPSNILNSHSEIGTYLLDKFRTIKGEHYPIFAYLVSKDGSVSLILSCADTVDFQLYHGSRRMGGGQKSVPPPPSAKKPVSVPSACATNFMPWSQTDEEIIDMFEKYQDEDNLNLIDDFLDAEFGYSSCDDDDSDDEYGESYCDEGYFYDETVYDRETVYSEFINGEIVNYNPPFYRLVLRNSQKVAQYRYESTPTGCTNLSCHFEHQNPRPSKKDHVMVQCRYEKQGGCTNPSCHFEHQNPRPSKKDHVMVQCRYEKQGGCTNPSCRYQHQNPHSSKKASP
jgi:hypothetical protein